MSKNTSETKKIMTVSLSKKPQGSKSKGTNTNAAKEKISEEGQRATRAEIQAFDLLNKFFDARSAHQYKSKFARLMHDYDLYKHIRSLSGAGIESDTTPTLDDDVWERLMASKPQAKSKIKEIKKAGFVHAAVWCLIAGN
ncbi:hypothetical protein PInf_021609 [Phytophthora infestans]|nr:hypothetical protein PInf_021609 [Phytophthora infestans]